MKRIEKILPLIMGVFGTVIVLDVFLEQFFNIGTKQSGSSLIYCISLVLLTTKYKGITKNKFVMTPLYIMIIQMCYSLITKGVL